MMELELQIDNEQGLHAKPAEIFVRMANRFKSELRLRNLTTDSPEKNAKSILHVLSLGIYRGHRIHLTANGEDEEAALAEISRLVRSNFAAHADQPGHDKAG